MVGLLLQPIERLGVQRALALLCCLAEGLDEFLGNVALLMITHDWDDKAKWLRCMELLANQVVPALSR